MACGLYKMIMIQKPQRIQPGDSGFGFLLPINPPKIATLLLHGVKQDGKVCIAKANVRKIERDCSLRIRSQPHGLRHLCIALLERLDSGCRV